MLSNQNLLRDKGTLTRFAPNDTDSVYSVFHILIHKNTFDAQLLNERQTRLVKIHVFFYKQNNTHTMYYSPILRGNCLYVVFQFLKQVTVPILTALNYFLIERPI